MQNLKNNGKTLVLNEFEWYDLNIKLVEARVL